MQISEQEISRLLAYSPFERGGSATQTISTDTAVVRSVPAARANASDSARDVERVKAILENLPDVREDRVQELKARIENGTYHVSSEDIADLIIRRALADNTGI